jgi:predicted RNase H-like HicB family nuclease
MQFEVDVEKTEANEWIATAIAYGVKVTGRTEPEALARLMDALALHFKTQRTSR